MVWEEWLKSENDPFFWELKKKKPGQQIACFFFPWILLDSLHPVYQLHGKKGESGWDAFVGTPTLLAWFHFFLVLHQTFFKYATKSQWLPGKQRKTRKWKTNTQKNGKNIPQKICTSPKKAPKLYEVVEILVRLLQTFTLLKISRNPSGEPWRWSFFCWRPGSPKDFLFIPIASMSWYIYLHSPYLTH